jgi:hypothetical protein
MKRIIVSFCILLVMILSMPMSGYAADADRVSIMQNEVLGGEPYTQKVLVLSFDPVFPMNDGKHLHEFMRWWNDPRKLSEQYISAMQESSHGNALYQIVDWIDIEALPLAKGNKGYTLEDYYADFLVAKKRSDYWSDPVWKRYGQFDYNLYMERYTVYDRVQSGEIDEVWVFIGPMTGTEAYESIMIGQNAYWCNSPPIQRNDCPPFVCYVFNYERDLGCMLEDAGHRMESIMTEVFGWNTSKPVSQMNDWELFTLYDKISPGNAGCGNVHFAPNSESDYDWGNRTKVDSMWKDWANYPDLTGKTTRVNADDWGEGDMAAHHKWWFSCIPHVQGINVKSGKLNNWWLYFKYPDLDSLLEQQLVSVP